jgi:putative transposase
MPEHIHLLTDEPAIGTLATFLQIFKQLTSRELKPIGQKQFWQRRYYDFNVHTEEKRIEKIRYIHRNPVMRGLVSSPEDYDWSSFNHYATGERGPVEVESEWAARRHEETAV